MKQIKCRTCGVINFTKKTEKNKDASVLESNWCVNCKYLAKDEYNVYYTFKTVKTPLKRILKQKTLL